MKFNGAIVSKPLKDELEKVLVPLEEKIDDTTANAMEFRDVWKINAQYHTNDVITFGTELYIALQDSKSTTTPPFNPKSWKKIGVLQQKSMQRATVNIQLTDIASYEPTQTPEAVFSATLEAQNILLRITKIAESEDPEYTLTSPIISGGNSAIIYAIVVKTKSPTIKAYKTTLTASGASTVEITAPSTVTVYYDYTD